MEQHSGIFVNFQLHNILWYYKSRWGGGGMCLKKSGDTTVVCVELYLDVR